MLHGGRLRDFHRSKYRSFSQKQVKFLQLLKEQGFEPNVIYDIGAGCLHWVREAKRFWPDASYILFEADKALDFLYHDYEYHIGSIRNHSLMTDVQRHALDTRNLDDVVSSNSFPLPDFAKVDARDGCLSIFLEGRMVLSQAKLLLMELQDVAVPELHPVLQKYGWELYHSIHYEKTNYVDVVYLNKFCKKPWLRIPPSP